MKKKITLCILTIILISSLSLAETTPSPETFKKVGDLFNAQGEIEGSIEIKGDHAHIEEADGEYSIESENEAYTLRIEGQELEIPPNTMTVINTKKGKLVTGSEKRKITIELIEESEGTLSLTSESLEKNDILINLPDYNELKILPEGTEKKEIEIKEGYPSITGHSFEYEDKYSSQALVVKPLSTIDLSENGLSGKMQFFKDKERKDLLGEVKGEDLKVVFHKSPFSKIGKNVVAFSPEEKKVSLFGTMEYQDPGKPLLTTTDAQVIIEEETISFLGGRGMMKSPKATFIIDERGKILTRAYLKKYEGPPIEKDFFLETKDVKASIQKSGIFSMGPSTSKLFISNAIPDIYKHLSEERKKVFLELKNKFGLADLWAGHLAETSHPVKRMEPFLKEGVEPYHVPVFLEEWISIDQAKPYFKIGEKGAYHIRDNLEFGIKPEEVEPYLKEGITQAYQRLIKEGVPIERVKAYQEKLEGMGYRWEEDDLRWGGNYANLHGAGITPEELQSYQENLKKISKGNLPGAIKAISDIPKEKVTSYVDKGMKNGRKMQEFWKRNIQPEEAEKEYSINHGGEVIYLYPKNGIKKEDIENYPTILAKMSKDPGYAGNQNSQVSRAAEEIAELKFAGITQEEANSLSEEEIKEIKEEVKELRMQELGLTMPGRYDPHTLDTLYRNTKATKAEKPIAIIALNRNDWSGAFKGDQRYALLLDTHHTIVVETDNDQVIKERIQQIRQRFNKKGAIYHLGGHGSSSGISYGPSEDRVNHLPFDSYRIDKKDTPFSKPSRKTPFLMQT